MMFLFLQLVFWLLIAGILGFAAGWFLQARRMGAKLTEQRERYRQHVQRLELGLVDAVAEEEPYAKEHREPVEVSENSGSFLSGMEKASAERDEAAKTAEKSNSKPESLKAEKTGLKTGQTVTLSPLQPVMAADAAVSDMPAEVLDDAVDTVSEEHAPEALLDETNAAPINVPAEWALRLSGCEKEISSLKRRLGALERGELVEEDVVAQVDEPEAKEAVVTPSASTSLAKAATSIQPYGLKAPDGEIDDLKRIWGVGPKLEKMLHGMGIYHFRQIAAFSADDVESVSARLEQFSDRVKRDDWISQAEKLMAEQKKD